MDLATIDDDELHATFDQLVAKVGACHPDDRQAWHMALMQCTAELGRRTDAWIAGRA